MNKTRYVAGLMFNDNFSQVALIQKKRPEKQLDKWNAVGGKVKDGESHIDAMVREFHEEVGYIKYDWLPVCVLIGETYEVLFYYTTGDLSLLEDKTDEIYDIFNMEDIFPYNHYELVPPLKSVISLVLDRKEIELCFNLILRVKE